MTQADPKIAFNIKDVLKKMLKGSVPVISTDTLSDSIGRKSDWVILDSRELAEFEISHLPDAKWVGHSDFSLLRVSGIPKDTQVVVYCSIGIRSEKIAEKLMTFGFCNVWNLYGGIFTWANEHKALVEFNQKPTLSVHGYDQNWGKLLGEHILRVQTN